MRINKGKPPVALTTEGLNKHPNFANKDIYMSNIVAENVKTIEFHGDVIETLLINEQPYVALKPICDGIGLDWKSQRNRINRDEVLNSVGVITTSTGSDGKKYEMLCLPLKMLNGWLFGISVNRVKPSLRERLTEYRRECFDVLADYWQRGYAINPRPFKQGRDDILNLEEASMLRCMLDKDAKMLFPDDGKKQGVFIKQGWSKLKSHFGVTYKQIPRHELTSAISILQRHGLEWQGKEVNTPESLIQNKMRTLKAFVYMDTMTGESQVSLIDRGCISINPKDQSQVKGLIHELDKSMYPMIFNVLFEYYRGIEKCLHVRRRKPNDMPAGVHPLDDFVPVPTLGVASAHS